MEKPVGAYSARLDPCGEGWEICGCGAGGMGEKWVILGAFAVQKMTGLKELARRPLVIPDFSEVPMRYA